MFFIHFQMSDKTYAMFNTITITGRVSHAEEVTNTKGETWVSVTLLSELQNDAAAVAVTFNSSNGLLSNFRNGWLTNGRRMTVTGHLASFSEVYTEKNGGATRMLKRPKMHLVGVQVLPGGFGPAQKKETPVINHDVVIDVAPPIEEVKESLEKSLVGASEEITF